MTPRNAEATAATSPHYVVLLSGLCTMEDKMKAFECGTLVPGCTWHTKAEDTAEIVRRVTEHLRSAHEEEVIRPNMVEEIKARIHEVEKTEH